MKLVLGIILLIGTNGLAEENALSPTEKLQVGTAGGVILTVTSAMTEDSFAAAEASARKDIPGARQDIRDSRTAFRSLENEMDHTLFRRDSLPMSPNGPRAQYYADQIESLDRVLVSQEQLLGTRVDRYNRLVKEKNFNARARIYAKGIRRASGIGTLLIASGAAIATASENGLLEETNPAVETIDVNATSGSR
jgi:hypothetical protein